MPAARVSGTELTLECVAIERTKQIRPDAICPVGSVAAHFAFGEEGRRRCRLRRDRNLGAWTRPPPPRWYQAVSWLFAIAECGHVCLPGLLESHRARARPLGPSPPVVANPPAALPSRAVSLPSLLPPPCSPVPHLPSLSRLLLFSLIFLFLSCASRLPRARFPPALCPPDPYSEPLSPWYVS